VPACLFPEHSPGRKHERHIELADWQYSFKQVSTDIRTIFSDACDRLGLHWTAARTTICVSRKRDVAILDEFIGPKR